MKKALQEKTVQRQQLQQLTYHRDTVNMPAATATATATALYASEVPSTQSRPHTLQSEFLSNYL